MPRLDTPVFVGREADLAVLLAHGDETETGNPRLVLVGGDAGVGKSRLVAEAVTRLVDRGFTAAFGSCVDIPGLEVAQVPFGPFREAARRLGGPAASWLRPGGGTDVSNPTPDAEPAYERLSGFLELIATVTADGPLVLVLEDLHWADRSSLALLVFLAHNLTQERVLLLATVRDQAAAAEAALEHLVRQPGVTRLTVGPLPDESVRSLVAQLPVQRSKSSVDAVVARAEGNPLVAYELAHADAGKLPPNLAASVRDRLRRASEPARSALTAASVAGPTVEHDLLLRLLDVPMPGASPDELDEAVREAVATGLLRPDGDGYRFRHGLDRDAIYGGLLPGRRQVLHRAAALALADTDELDSGLAARVAAHWRHAGDRDAARRAALDAARAAQAVGAYPEALAQYEHVLDRIVADPEAAELLIEAAEVARLSGDLPKATGLLERATGSRLPPGPAARAWERLGWFRHEAGDDDGSAAAYERALQVIAGNPDPEAAPRVLAAHARSLMLAGQFAAAGDKAREALDAIATPEPSGEAGASALITLGTVIANRGEPDEGLAMLARGRDLAAALGAEQERWRYLTNVVYVLQNIGRNAEAADVALSELKTVKDRPWLPPAANGAAANAAECLLHLGRWQEAQDLLEDITRRRPPPRFLFQLTMCRAELELVRGRREAAAGHLETVSRIFATIRDPDDRSAVHRLRAESAWQAGDVSAARRHVDAALDELRDSEEYESQVTVLALGLRVEADAQRLPAGRDARRLAQLAGQLDATASQVRETQPDARLEILLGRAELLRAGGDDGRARWASVIDEARLLDRPYLQAYAWWQAGEAALRTRHRTEAQAALVNAASLAEKLGAAWLLAAARATMTRGRLNDDSGATTAPSAPTRAASAGLTAREIQVLALLAEGRTNRVIARELGMSEKTASVHVSRILAKLGASTRGEAAATARTLHLLEDAVLPPPHC